MASSTIKRTRAKAPSNITTKMLKEHFVNFIMSHGQKDLLEYFSQSTKLTWSAGVCAGSLLKALPLLKRFLLLSPNGIMPRKVMHDAIERLVDSGMMLPGVKPKEVYVDVLDLNLRVMLKWVRNLACDDSDAYDSIVERLAPTEKKELDAALKLYKPELPPMPKSWEEPKITRKKSFDELKAVLHEAALEHEPKAEKVGSGSPQRLKRKKAFDELKEIVGSAPEADKQIKRHKASDDSKCFVDAHSSRKQAAEQRSVPWYLQL